MTSRIYTARRPQLLLLLLAAAALLGCSDGLQTPRFSRPAESEAPDTPAVRLLRAGAADANLIIIVADAARADHFSAFGYERNTTPHLDEFFRQATLFSEAYAPAADTKASIASLFTAQYPDTHGVVGRSVGLGPDAGATLAECMRAAGRITVVFSANPYLCAPYGFARGFDSFEEVFRQADLQPMGAGRVDGALLLTAATGWLRAHQDKRFFAYLHFLEPHAPYTPPPAYRDRLDDRGLPQGADDMLDYDANLAYVDDLIGRFLAELDRLDLLDKSVVVFLSDHGEAFGEHGAYHHERVTYQEMIHVPVAFRLPASCRAPHQTRPEVFSHTDVLPTLLDLFQLPPPDTMQGRSRLRLLAGGDEPEPAFAVSRARGDDDTGGVKRPDLVNYAFRVPQYTVIVTAGDHVELYDRATDPPELHDLAKQETKVIKHLHRQFQSWGATQRARPAVLPGGTVFVPDTKRVVVDEKTRQQLRNLGYLQ
jgi:arylsulfatase A-like enzyme